MDDSDALGILIGRREDDQQAFSTWPTTGSLGPSGSWMSQWTEHTECASRALTAPT